MEFKARIKADLRISLKGFTGAKPQNKLNLLTGDRDMAFFADR
jgi:hypothetical protein